jgi:leukotriene-A4 hydrolase
MRSGNVRSVAFGALLILTACSSKPVAPPTSASVPHDPSSYANTDAFVTKHIVLDLDADFDAKTLSGTAELSVERRNADASELVLDTRDLTIRGVETAGTAGAWSTARFRLDPSTPAFGSALRITMPRDAARVRITYTTSPSAKGLQWLTPAQTAGKKHPFLFSQAQAIQARSFVPLQDLPGVRVTYDATLHTPKELVAVMAAEMKPGEAGSGVFHFRMPQPIPSYLIALAIGDLTFKPLSERAGVWAEPSMIEAASREFEDTEKMIKTTESLYGPYRWGRYDLLVLPPSFPFGGMENPRLTFATPTVIVGDKSLVALVAHELAHSWSGNLVTNATWKDFWLNEGFTTYLERRIVEVLYGAPFARMEGAIGVRDLAEDREVAEQAADKTLQPELKDRDPDDATSRVPYEQGALFLTFLESKFGRDAFDAFLRRWFDDHAFKSATTDEFLSFLKAHLLSTKPGAVTDAQIQEWLHTDGVPAFAVLPSSDAFAKVEQARDAWLGGGSIAALAKTASSWSTQEWLHFIDTMPRKMEATRLTALDRQFTLTESQNAEIAHSWYRLAIANRYTAAYPAMERYMIRIGRRKLVVPLYRDLASTPEGRPLATAIYEKARGGYHAMTRDGVETAMRRAAS